MPRLLMENLFMPVMTTERFIKNLLYIRQERTKLNSNRLSQSNKEPKGLWDFNKQTIALYRLQQLKIQILFT